MLKHPQVVLLNVSAGLYKLLIKIFMLQLMETYRCRDRRASAVSQSTCADTLGPRGPSITSEVFTSHIHLQKGTFPGNRRQLASACLVKRVLALLVSRDGRLVDGSRAAD